MNSEAHETKVCIENKIVQKWQQTNRTLVSDLLHVIFLIL